MNRELRELFDKNNIITKKITIKNNVRIIDNGEEQLVIKRRDKDLSNIYKYLKSRSFDLFPDLVYQTTKFGVDIPEPEIDKHIAKTPSYTAWYNFYANNLRNG